MKHIRQTGMTCFPTVLAMLSGQTEDAVVARALGPGKKVKDWDKLMDYDRRHATSEIQHQKLNAIIEPLVKDIAPWLPAGSFSTWSRESYAAALAFPDKHPDVTPRKAPKGRGVITLITDHKGKLGRHIIAFEDGFVFDPSAPMPLRWIMYWWMAEELGAKMSPEEIYYDPNYTSEADYGPWAGLDRDLDRDFDAGPTRPVGRNEGISPIPYTVSAASRKE